MTGDAAKALEAFQNTVREAALLASRGQLPADRLWSFHEARHQCLVLSKGDEQPRSNEMPEEAISTDAAEAYYKKLVEEASKADANNSLYGIEAVEDYNPGPDLHKIKAKLMAINSADDEANPPALHVMEPAIAKIPGARYVLIPQSEQTHGHYTHLRAAIWKPYLVEFLKTLPPMK